MCVCQETTNISHLPALIFLNLTLTGLSRTCEVMGAEELVVQNLDVAQNSEFQQISVTAERWLTMRETPTTEALYEYLLQKRQQGYQLVALEQTHNSVPLQDFQFSTKTVIVLGAEREGLPAQLAAAVDACVEIPQRGFIRSLNVHVSASMCVWSYCQQFC